MRKTLSFFLVLCLTLFLTACIQTEEKELYINRMFPKGTEGLARAEETVAEPKSSVGFSLWSVGLGGREDAEEYVELLKKSGFTSIDLAVMWSDFEVTEGHYSWKFLDEVMDVFQKAGYQFNLSVVFWDYNLSFGEKLDLQETATGEIYTGDSISKGFLCLNSENNLQHIKKALLAFCAHMTDRYPESILSWEIRLSEKGETEYSPTVDLDYSPLAYEAFLAALRRDYETVARFNTAYQTEYESWEDVGKEEKTILTSIATFDWKLFKQDSLIAFSNEAASVFRAVDPSIPVIFRIGTVGDSMSALYRGIIDPYAVASRADCDILFSDYFTEQSYNFYLDMMTTTTKKAIAFEIEGPRGTESEMEDTIILAEEAGRTGICALSVSNWKKSEIEPYRKDYLDQYVTRFTTAEMRPDADPTDVIIINTLDFIVRKPPSSVYGLYKYAYRNMSGKKEKKVVFYTDTQVIENPSLLDGVTKVHLGSLNNVTYMYDALGDILAEGNYIIVDDDNQQPNFINEYSRPLDSDVQDKLRTRLKES